MLLKVTDRQANLLLMLVHLESERQVTLVQEQLVADSDYGAELVELHRQINLTICGFDNEPTEAR